MKNLGRAMLRVAKILEELEPDDRISLARQMYTNVIGPLPVTEAERSARYRIRHAENVTNGHDVAVTNGHDVDSLLPGFSDPKDSGTTGARTEPEKKPAFAIPATIVDALGKCPTLLAIGRADVTLQKPRLWQTFVRAYPGVNFARELLEAEAWALSNPQKAPRSSVPAFLHRWFKRASERLEAS